MTLSQVFSTSHKDMVVSLEQGDVAETVRIYFEKSHICPPQKKSSLSMQQVGDVLMCLYCHFNPILLAFSCSMGPILF